MYDVQTVCDLCTELLVREIYEPIVKMAIVILNFKKIPGHSGPGC